MVHNIKVPKSVSINTKNLSGTLHFSTGLGKKLSDAFNRAQKSIDEDVLRYSSPYVPFDSGTLDKSGTDNTKVGSGEVIYKTPYARKVYYDDANYQGAPMRGKLWFERMKADKKDAILKSAAKELYK